MKVIYPAIFHAEDGGFWVEFPDLPGCFTQGDTESEAYANAVETMELFLQDDYTIDTLPTKLKPIKRVSYLLFVANLK